MMKKAMITFLFCAAMLQGQAFPFQPVGIQVVLQVEMIGINPGSDGHQFPKSPGEPPVVYLDAPTLYICSEHEGYTLTVKDSDETVVFSTYIPEGTYTAVLPLTLSGDYILQLSDDTYVYEGEIEL